MARMDGKIAFITGGASGLGRAEARMLAREGAAVVITDVNEEMGRAVAAEIGCSFIAHDVRSEQEWAAAIAWTVQRFGRLDVLINNAGVVLMADVEHTTLDQFRFINAVHAEGTFLGCKYGMAAMKECGGVIVNTSSLTALRGYSATFAYAAAKGAIRSMTTTVAAHCREHGYRVRCNAIFPGVIDTPLVRTALGDGVAGLGQPDDVANAVLFLASDESRHLNGAELVIDNGVAAMAAA